MNSFPKKCCIKSTPNHALLYIPAHIRFEPGHAHRLNRHRLPLRTSDSPCSAARKVALQRAHCAASLPGRPGQDWRNPIADVLQCCASARRKLGTATGKPRRCGLSTLPTGSGKVSASAARPGLANSHPRRLAQAGRAMATLAPVRAWRWHQCGNAVDQLQQCEVQFVYLRTWLVTGGRAALLGTAVHQSSPLLC